jgi:hypothetical protein
MLAVMADIAAKTNTVNKGSKDMGGIQTADASIASYEEMMPELRLLTVGQKSLVLGYLATGDKEASSRDAGYSSTAAAEAAWRSPRVQAAIKALARAEIQGAAVIMAVRTMQELMEAKPGRSDAVRLTAAKWVLESAGHGAKADPGGLSDKPLAEMTEDELARFITAQQGVIDKHGHAGIIDVTPNK